MSLCIRCNGSGQNTALQTICRACNGTGSSITTSGGNTTDNNPAATYAANKPEIVGWLEANAKPGNFARSLLDGLTKFGRLTEKQEAVVVRILAENKAKGTPVKIDLTPVFDKFRNAQAAGLKKPKMRLEGLAFSLAGGRNAGSLYVKAGPAYEDTYLGKVSPAGEFHKSRDCTDENLERLQAVSGDVLAAAVAYGQKTGQCACCGRELTNPESIARSIGPICYERYFG